MPNLQYIITIFFFKSDVHEGTNNYIHGWIIVQYGIVSSFFLFFLLRPTLYNFFTIFCMGHKGNLDYRIVLNSFSYRIRFLLFPLSEENINSIIEFFKTCRVILGSQIKKKKEILIESCDEINIILLPLTRGLEFEL